MNNKKGGFGAKLILVLILMIASAAGGAYGYRVLDGKMAVRDAMKAVEDVDISDYDAPEQSVIQGYIDDAKKNLETAQTRKEVYEIIGAFIADVDKVQTLNEKKLEEALKAAEEAKQQSMQNTQNNQNSQDTLTDNGGYKSNELNTNTETDNTDSTDNTINTNDNNDEEGGGGFLGSLLGGMSSGSGGN